jgi:hypothetical protein
MTEIDKLIKAIEIHYGDGDCEECPYCGTEVCGSKLWRLVKDELLKSKDSPANVFVIQARAFFPDWKAQNLQEEIVEQVKSGVLVLPPYLELVAVTGPCTDVEVKMITREEEQGDG